MASSSPSVMQYSKFQILDTNITQIIAFYNCCLKIHPCGLDRSGITFIVEVLSPAIARRAAVCIGIWYRKQLQGMGHQCER